MTIDTIESPGIKVLAQRAEEMDRLFSAGYFVVTPEQYEDAASDLSEVKQRIKALDGKRKELTRPLDESKKRIVEFFKRPTECYQKVQRIIEREMLTYRAEQQKKQRMEEEEARRKAEKEAELQRERLRKEAQEAERKGDEVKAEILMEEVDEVVAPPVIVQSEIPKPNGTAIRTDWYAVITDVSKIPLEFLLPDMPKLNRLAQATKGTLSVPGVVFKSKEIIVSRRG